MKNVQNEQWNLWQRNVQDKYKNLSTEEIKNNLKQTAFPCAVLMSQLKGDFNFSSVIRAANNFNLSKVFYFGKKQYDRRGAQGCYHYFDVVYLPTLDDIINLKRDYIFVGLENNVSDTIPIKDFIWQLNSLIVLGEEGAGIPEEIFSILDYKIEIPTLGSIRSLNVASAASIAMYDYVCKFKN